MRKHSDCCCFLSSHAKMTLMIFFLRKMRFAVTMQRHELQYQMQRTCNEFATILLNVIIQAFFPKLTLIESDVNVMSSAHASAILFLIRDDTKMSSRIPDVSSCLLGSFCLYALLPTIAVQSNVMQRNALSLNGSSAFRRTFT